MTKQQRFKSTDDLMAAVSDVHTPGTGEAEALPLPRKARPRGTIHVVVLFYKEGMRPREETVYPPHHLVTVNAGTGDVVESRPCAPSDFGVAKAPGEPTAGFGLDPAMPVDEFWARLDRFKELSPTVWAPYADGVTRLDPNSLDVVREYAACFHRIAKQPLMPYYQAVAGDFLVWLEAVTR